MILVHCIRLEQSYDLTTGNAQTYLILGLPNGKEAKALIDEDTAADILSRPTSSETLAAPTKEEPTFPASAPISTAGLQPAAKAPEPVEQLVEWQSVSDEELSPVMKLALHKLGVPAQLPVGVLRQICSQIVDQFTPEDWQSVSPEVAPPVEAIPRPPAPAPPPAVPRAPLQQVTWATGQPIMAASRPPRTVPKDDKGYPIVPRTGVSSEQVLGGSAGGIRDAHGVQSI
jgi:hypothetical protein